MLNQTSRNGRSVVLSFVLGALLLIASPPAMAGCSANNCSGIGDQVLKSFYPASGLVYLEPPSAADKAALNCTLVSGHYMTLKQSHNNYDVILSTVLTAIAAGHHLTVRIVEGSADCKVSYVRMWL